MPTNIQTFSVISTGGFNAASSGASLAFGFNATQIFVQNIGSVALWAKLGTTGVASSGDLCISSCVGVSEYPRILTVDLGQGLTADRVSIFATSTAAGQFVVNALR